MTHEEWKEMATMLAALCISLSLLGIYWTKLFAEIPG
jgi:hypothetical protein